jgi:hypothetical protein
MHEAKVGVAPALAAIAVIAALAGSLWWRTREEPQAAAMPALQPVLAQAEAAPRPPPPAVLTFAGFADGEAPAELPLDHGYTSEGLRQLAAALAALGGNSLWQDRARRLEEAAALLERDADSLEHADIARTAFMEAAGWIDDLRGGAEAALDAARAIDVEAPLGSQAEAVSRFFRDAAAALRPRRAGRDDNRA